MHFGVPAFHEIECPKCTASNTDTKHYIWKVVDERGRHFECKVCAHAWPDVGQELKRFD